MHIHEKNHYMRLGVILSLLHVSMISSAYTVDAIKHQLKEMVTHDQDIRARLIQAGSTDAAFITHMEAYAHQATATLKEMLQQYHWITVSLFGKEADHHAWLLVQHADHDVAFQKDVLARLALLYQQHETSARNYAYLYDRVALNEGRPQRYGTQGTIVDSHWVAHTVECPAALDSLRHAVGLPAMADYVEQVRLAYQLS